MSRFIPHTDMSGDQIIQCSYELQAILQLVEAVTFDPDDHNSVEVNGAICRLMDLGLELHAQIHDALELHEGRAKPKAGKGDPS